MHSIYHPVPYHCLIRLDLRTRCADSCCRLCNSEKHTSQFLLGCRERNSGLYENLLCSQLTVPGDKVNAGPSLELEGVYADAWLYGCGCACDWWCWWEAQSVVAGAKWGDPSPEEPAFGSDENVFTPSVKRQPLEGNMLSWWWNWRSRKCGENEDRQVA